MVVRDVQPRGGGEPHEVYDLEGMSDDSKQKLIEAQFSLDEDAEDDEHHYEVDGHHEVDIDGEMLEVDDILASSISDIMDIKEGHKPHSKDVVDKVTKTLKAMHVDLKDLRQLAKQQRLRATVERIVEIATHLTDQEVARYDHDDYHSGGGGDGGGGGSGGSGEDEVVELTEVEELALTQIIGDLVGEVPRKSVVVIRTKGALKAMYPDQKQLLHIQDELSIKEVVEAVIEEARKLTEGEMNNDGSEIVSTDKAGASAGEEAVGREEKATDALERLQLEGLDDVQALEWDAGVKLMVGTRPHNATVVKKVAGALMAMEVKKVEVKKLGDRTTTSLQHLIEELVEKEQSPGEGVEGLAEKEDGEDGNGPEGDGGWKADAVVEEHAGAAGAADEAAAPAAAPPTPRLGKQTNLRNLNTTRTMALQELIESERRYEAHPIP